MCRYETKLFGRRTCLIGMSGVPQVRVGVVGQAMQLIGNHIHFMQFYRVQFRLLHVQLFSNCTQMCVITYSYKFCLNDIARQLLIFIIIIANNKIYKH